MLVILDPPGNTPIFLSVTQNLTQKERHKAAYLAIGTAFLVISMFAIGGQSILDYLNVSVPALQGAGGMLLLLVALQLLYGKGPRTVLKQLLQNSARQWRWFPLALHFSQAQAPLLPPSFSFRKPMALLNGSVFSQELPLLYLSHFLR